MHFEKLLTYTVCSVLSLGLGSTLKADCPKLDLNTLPKAICADATAPMTPPGGNMQYISSEAAKDDCKSTAKKVGFAKTLQGIFKGQKEYTGQEKVTQAGKISCSYNLPDNWKKNLKTDDASFTLKAPINAYVTTGITGASLCSKISYADLKNLMAGQIKSEKKGAISGGQTFDWELQGKINQKTFAMAGPVPAPAEMVTGVLKIDQPFIHTCTYTYHPGGVATSFTLTGTQVK